MEVIYPGSFDPVTNGHLDLIERAAGKFDRVTVAVLNNSVKNSLFSLKEKVDMIEKATKKYGNVDVDSFDGLLIDYVASKGKCMVIRGLRAVSDFEFEMQMALANRKLNAEVETLFLVSSSEYAFLSSSLVKEIAKYKGDVSSFVPKNVEIALKNKFLEDRL